MSARIQVRRRRALTAQERESNFQLSSAPAPLPTYDALRDANLRQYFESRTVQKYLQSSGWVDKDGKIVDLDKFRGKLNIIEQEFKYAEKTEFWRLKEEEEMRRTIQIKRERALVDAKKMERAKKIKEENRIRKGLISAVKGQPNSNIARLNIDPSSSPRGRSPGQQDSPEEMSARGVDKDMQQQQQQQQQQQREPLPAAEAGDGGGFFVTQHRGD
mmetsp:Transcript_12850/g.25588  ORF Transcript_12850/g.25588 Transcript_12850/m.25588 type:complete len:216 (-) Transcript_12850:94-741(-)|eukprot:CAMPEP_0181308418 /NCGR_PEP_ID=MMETSP1101-20121128/11452_1 /TAXON_ID=46948 /ORGANISM="Rhodomonas abbreviata, Strain Caron Lab Isolate" /LENGTH=215 /DNA_ID=CAMNT_0023414799 /DNA_START=274 /DNA_END=921 /DNA_ORIENTATION=-